MIRNYFFLCTILSALTGYSQSIELTTEEIQDKTYYEDSIGNLISLERARMLLKTGEYISIPYMNELMEIEHLIRRKTEEDGDRYQTITDGQMVVSGTGLAIPAFKLSMGDTLPNLSAYNHLGNLKNSNNSHHSVLVFIDPEEWVSIRQDIQNLIQYFPEVNFILVDPNFSENLGNLFTRRFLERNHNIYMIQEKTDLWQDAFPFCYVVEPSNRIELLIPQLPDPRIGISAVTQYLSRKH